jgi:EmrB/QacA subfamily drug resistance transporter
MRWWTLSVLALSLVVIGLDNTILNVAIPTLQREFGASATELQWMVDAYILVFAGLLLTMGALGDRFGRKRALQAGLIVFTTASFGAAYSQSAGQLIAARALMGVGGALIMPSTLSVLVDVFPREERGRAIGMWAGVAALGIGLGPMLGGWLLGQFWWGAVFLVNVPVTAAALLLGLVLVPESRDETASSLDLVGAALSFLGLSALVYAIIEAPGRGWTDGLVLGAFASAAVLLTAFVSYELRARRPMLGLRLFRNPRLSAGAGAIALAFMAMFGSVFLLTQYLQFVQGYTALEAGVRLAPVALGMMVGAANSHLLVRRLGTKRVVASGLTVVATVLAFASLLEPTTSYWAIATGLIVLAFGMANTMAPATEAVMGAVPEANAGVGSALNDTVRQVGGALGVAILGSALNAAYSSGMAQAIAPLPPALASAARDSVGAAVQIAAQVGGPVGEALHMTALEAFVDATSVAVLIAAAIALVGAVLVLAFMPAREAAPDVAVAQKTRDGRAPIQ